MMRDRKISLLPLLMATLCGGLSRGWCGDEAAVFQEFHGKYQAYLKEHVKPLAEGYQRKLTELEKGVAQKRDYALAAKIKAAREAALRELGLTPAAAAPVPPATLAADGSVTLEAAQATLAGGVTLDVEKQVLMGWAAEASARWQLPTGLKTGGYEVELTYACSGRSGAVVIKEGTYFVKRPVQDTGSWLSYQPTLCGTLRIKSTSQQLSITAAVAPSDGLFYLRQVRLLPCAAL